MPQTRGSLYTTLDIKAPRKLANSAVSAQALTSDFAREITNMIPSTNRAGSLAKRFGVADYGVAIPSGNIRRVFDFITPAGVEQIIVTTDVGVVYKTEDAGASWTSIKTGLDVNAELRAVDYTDAGGNTYLIMFNGVDPNQYWDGTSFNNIVDRVRENGVAVITSANSFTIDSSTDNSDQYPVGGTVDMDVNIESLEISSITASSGTATVTTAASHNLVTGDFVRITNAYPSDYNKNARITVTGATTFTYEVPTALSTAATVYRAGMKMVKGVNKPRTELRTFENEEANPIIRPPVPITRINFKATIGVRRGTTFAQPLPASTTLRISQRRKGTYEWSFRTAIAVAPRTGRDINLEVDKGEWEFRLELPDYPDGAVQLTSLTTNGRETYDVDAVENDPQVGEIPTEENTVGITSITRSGDVATVTTEKAHALSVDDAVTLYDVEQAEYNSTFIVVSAPTTTTFTFKVEGEPATPATPNPALPTTISLSALFLNRTANILTSVYAAGTLTVTVDNNLFPAAGKRSIENLEYEDSPKPFYYMSVHEGIIYALAADINKRSNTGDVEATRIYYTQATGSLSSWFSDVTQRESYFDVGGQNNFAGAVVGMSSLNGQLIIHGRRQLQIWGGGISPVDPTFQWLKTINVGTVHPDLIQQYPQDVLFFSDYGARSVQNVFKTETLEVVTDLGSSQDPAVQAAVRALLASDEAYAKARSFFYAPDGLYGFALGGEPFIYALSEEARGWVRFNGAFTGSASYVATAKGGLLLLTSANKLAVYRNGQDGNPVTYDDFGGAIRTVWWSPWFKFNGRFSNIWWEFEVEAESLADITFQRYINGSETNPKDKVLSIDTRFPRWDETLWDTISWDGDTTFPRIRDKFMANSLAIRLVTETTTGGFEIVGIKARGSR